MIRRRNFLASLMAATVLPTLGWAEAGNPRWLAAARDPDDSFALYGLAEDGSARFRIPLPGRGHAGAAHPTRALAVAFARRPGTFALVIDCALGIEVARLTPPEGVQFNGHGAFLQGGAILATSEQWAEDSAGQVGLWDVAAGFARIGAWATGGLGPHELRLMPDEQSLVVANGGIATDAQDRTKLNIPDMHPSLIWLSDRGETLARHEPDPALRQASIRHLAVRPDGLTAFAMQWEGDPSQVVPLLGLIRPGEAPILAEGPDLPAMQGYAGSVAFFGDGEAVAITSPKGGQVQWYDSAGQPAGTLARGDICGAAPAPGGLLTSDGGGALILIETGGPRLLARHATAWDNHIVTLPA